MSLILQIDTAVDAATISIAKDGIILKETSNHNQKEHAAFIQPAIQSMMKETGISLQETDAIAVNAGPGSYTGLRVGMASAKGLCYALNKPLIAINSLMILAKAAQLHATANHLAADIFCPMIDARRMEVFTALYNKELKELVLPSSAIVDADFFANWLLKNKIIFYGNGAFKLQPFLNTGNAFFPTEGNNTLAMSILSYQHFEDKLFADLAYTEPMYIKEFYTTAATK